MADLAFGLAKSAVVGTLTLAKSAIEEDKKLQKSVKCDLMLIADEFEMMNAFLNVAKEGDADDMVKTLVRQVRDMALNVDDCIEFAIQLDKDSYWWRRWLPRCFPAAEPAAILDDIVAKIGLLKSRIESVGHRNKRYGHIRDSGSKPPIVQVQQLAEGNTTASDILTLHRLAKEKKRIPCDLVKFITEKYGTLSHHVIPVWGTGNDLGMTSIIREAFDNPNICQNFECRAWVKVPHPFNPQEFLQSLLMQLDTNHYLQQRSTRDVLNKMKALKTKGGLDEKLMAKFCEQRYLVVLEDVSSMVEWDTIRVYLPDRNKGCCIILYTQQFEIASSFTGNSYRVSEQKEFSSGDSIFVFINEDGNNDKDMTKESDARDWLGHFQLIGRMLDLGTLDEAISSNIVEVFAVLGIAGVGKSSLVKHLYYTKVTERQSFEKFGWVDVSHPFNLREFAWILLLDLHSGSLQHGSRLRFMDPVQECREFLRSHRCLVVVDGLDSIEEWDMAKSILLASSKSRIIVVTNEESVATSIAAKPSGSVWNVKGLEQDPALMLFELRVYEKSSYSNYPNKDLKEYVKDVILPRCGGLPKVIVAIADFMVARVNDREQWKFLSSRFMHLLETHPEFVSLQNVFACLDSYLRTCPDFLKSCIFSLSVFHESRRPFRRRRLLRRWTVDGYSSRDNKEIVVEATVEEFFLKLVKLGMIETQTNSRATIEMTMSMCQVNGFFHEYLVSRPTEENHVFALGGSFSVNSQCTVRHLVILPSWDTRDEVVFESIDLSWLRSLTVYGVWESFFISDKMRALRVLDLENATRVTNGDLKKIVKLLHRLKFLSLRGCEEISRLPDSIGRHLRKLETLDIGYTSIRKLPKSIVKLCNLRYIHAGFTAPAEASRSRGRVLDGVKVPEGIRCMVVLHTLGIIDARGVDIMEEILTHTQLHKLRASNISQGNYRKFCYAIQCLDHLESLSVGFDEDNQAHFLNHEIWDPPVNLRSLKLYGLRYTLPVWIRQLFNLQKLSLQMTMLLQTEKDTLASLPNLCTLSLQISDFQFQDGNLTLETAGFRRLLCLVIVCNSSLQTVKFGYNAMPKLEVLKIRCSSVPTLQFSGLNHLCRLMEVSISRSYDEAFKQQLKSKLNEHPNKIKPVLREETDWGL